MLIPDRELLVLRKHFSSLTVDQYRSAYNPDLVHRPGFLVYHFPVELAHSAHVLHAIVQSDVLGLRRGCRDHRQLPRSTNYMRAVDGDDPTLDMEFCDSQHPLQSASTCALRDRGNRLAER
eukprot:IDg559t1